MRHTEWGTSGQVFPFSVYARARVAFIGKCRPELPHLLERRWPAMTGIDWTRVDEGSISFTVVGGSLASTIATMVALYRA
jgi:hypothetical protein